MDKINNFYKNKKVFVTGHTGFKGSWLVAVLLKLGAKVTGYSLNDEKRKNYEKFVNYKKVKNIYSNILDLKKLNSAIKKNNPHVVFHLAAQPLVAESYKNPLNTMRTNLMGSINVMEVVRNCKGIKSLVMITSDKCYLNKEISRGYKENDLLGGEDPYSASKAAVEIVFYSYLKSFFSKNKNIGVATTRAGNVIGGGDWSENRIIPDCIRAIIKRKKFIIIRKPKATRPWQHVLEPVSGYLLLGLKLSKKPKNYSGSWNFGPQSNQVKRVKEVADYIIHNMHKKNKITTVFKTSNFKEAKLLKLNCKKAINILKWKPRWHMNESLKQTVIWYNYYLNNKNTKNITDNQIETYFKK